MMSKYRVLYAFKDGEDAEAKGTENHYYPDKPGKDTYPREGYTPTKKRINYLLGNGTRNGKPAIELIEEPLYGGLGSEVDV